MKAPSGAVPPAGTEPLGFLSRLRALFPRIVAGLAFAVVAGVTGVVSYEHIEALTLALGQHLMVARLMPFGIDGLIVVGSVALLQAGEDQPHLGWLCVGPGAVASLFANVESGIRYGPLGAAWAGMASLGFFLATFTLERWLKAQADQSQPGGRTEKRANRRRHGDDGTQMCSHDVGTTLDGAIVQAYLHTRDCLGNALSQRQLAEKFDIGRPRVAELLKPHLLSPALAPATGAPPMPGQPGHDHAEPDAADPVRFGSLNGSHS